MIGITVPISGIGVAMNCDGNTLPDAATTEINWKVPKLGIATN